MLLFLINVFEAWKNLNFTMQCSNFHPIFFFLIRVMCIEFSRKMVFCILNCSGPLWEKIVLLIKKKNSWTVLTQYNFLKRMLFKFVSWWWSCWPKNTGILLYFWCYTNWAILSLVTKYIQWLVTLIRQTRASTSLVRSRMQFFLARAVHKWRHKIFWHHPQSSMWPLFSLLSSMSDHSHNQNKIYNKNYDCIYGQLR